MSMICSVLGLSPMQIKALRATPALATAVAMAAEGVGRGDLRQLGPLQEPLSLEKSWHIQHYLFTGSVDNANPPGGALLGGEELGEDIGYGPVRLHDEKATAEFARFLETLDLMSLQERMNLGEMARIGIYGVPMGSIPDALDESELQEELEYFFPQLRDYVLKVAEKQGGLLVWLI